jgi:LmbE family N-acetylglucosaminyl deacetylase
MRLMAVMAHPDDAEIWCGGTLILRIDKGDTVRVCHLSYDDNSIRGREAQEGATLMGCEVESLGFEDTSIRDSQPASEKLRQTIQSFKPDTSKCSEILGYLSSPGKKHIKYGRETDNSDRDCGTRC